MIILSSALSIHEVSGVFSSSRTTRKLPRITNAGNALETSNAENENFCQRNHTK